MKYLPTFTMQFKPNVGKYSSPMDPMGNNAFVCFFNGNAVFWKELVIFCCIAGNKTVLCLTLLETMAISPECCSRLPLYDCALWNISENHEHTIKHTTIKPYQRRLLLWKPMMFRLYVKFWVWVTHGSPLHWGGSNLIFDKFMDPKSLVHVFLSKLLPLKKKMVAVVQEWLPDRCRW